MTLPPLAFIGGGNMATAMVQGLRRAPSPPPITVSEPRAEQRALLRDLGVAVTADNRAAVAAARVVVLAIKPQIAAEVVPELATAWTPAHCLISILAGTTTARLAGWLPPGARIVRAMPNTPLAIGLGMVGLCAGAHATPEDLAVAEELFAPCARVLRLADEQQMDAVTAVSGSGPAYVFRTAEALVAAAEQLGLARCEAELLVEQTLVGAVAYLRERGIAQAAQLRRAVTSPGGTTAAALAVLEAADYSGLWCRALAAAAQRGRELAAAPSG
ncbi:MAG: pyrroline-5-carboxylate reductase [Planctomycetota bacterium]|nr:pyrroline-5-carboxylate reductase [Planctomycetota bacterium]MCX8039367.1 pyrroline-5-carboxylate reductase [Planctomycetota bacterium]MDW8373347.1 pyrroline-5-carboxylate reductase [Planctomycetota bacterium]